MAEQSQNFQRIVQQKIKRIQWGVPQSEGDVDRHLFIATSNNIIEGQIPLRPTENVSAMNFRNMPIKQSEIIVPPNKQQFLDSHHNLNKRQVDMLDRELQNQHIYRIKQLKNQFDILRGTIIDSKILEADRYDKVSNLSKSNVGSVSQHIKTGEAIRAKQKQTRKSRVSSSSMSDKALSQQNSQFKFKGETKQKAPSNGPNESQINREDQLQRSHYSQKKSEHHSQIPRQKSKDSSRVAFHESLSKRALLSNSILEKQSLQIHLANCLQKIEALLQNQIVLKTRNKELQQMLKITNKQKSSQEAGRVVELEKKIQKQERTVQQYKRQNLQLVQLKAKLQAELIGSNSIMQILKQENSRYLNQAMSHKISYANLQIDNKRLQMEKNLQKKNLEYEIQRLKTEIQCYKNNQTQVNNSLLIKEEPILNFDKEKIKMLEQELEDQKTRHKKDLQQIQNMNTLRDQSQLLQLIEKFHDRKKHQTQSKSELSKELAGLKQQLIKIKREVDLSQSQFGFQSKVVSLQEAMKRDNQQKENFLIQIEHLQKLYEDLKQKYKKCEIKLQEEGERYLKATQKYKLDIEQADHLLEKYQTLEKQNELLRVKLAQLQNSKKDYQETSVQLVELRIAFKKLEDSHRFEMKQIRRKNDLVEFQSFKRVEEAKLNQQLERKKLECEISVLTGQLAAVQSELKYYRQELLNQKQLNERLTLKVNDMEFSKGPRITIEGHLKISQKQSLQREHEEQKIVMSRQFASEQEKLMQQVVALTAINQQLTQNLRKKSLLEVQNEELRELCKRKLSSESSILHLWNIKQVEYANLNSILNHFSSFHASQSEMKQNIDMPNASIPQVNSRIVKLTQGNEGYKKPSPPQLIGPQHINGLKISELSQRSKFVEIK